MNIIKLLVDFGGVSLEFIVAMLLYYTFWSARRIGKRYFALGFCGFSAVSLTAINFITHPWLLLLAYIVAFFFLGMLFENRIISRLLIALVLAAALSASEEMMGMALIYILDVSILDIQNDIYLYAMGVFASKLVPLILIYVLRIFVPAKNQFFENKWFNLLVIFLPLQSLILCFIIQRLEAVAEETTIKAFSVFMLSASFLLVFVVIVIMRNQMKYVMYKYEYEVAQHQLHAQAEHYNELYMAHQEIRGVSHDIKHQMTAVSGLLREKKVDSALEYIEHTLLRIKSNEGIAYTGQPMIDAVLNAKIRYAADNNIFLHCKMLYENELFIDPMDVAIILGNALDNAIEAVMRGNEIDKSISLVIADKSDYLFVIVQNHTSQAMYDMTHTSKDDKVNHGLGIRQMKLLAEKYNGNLSVEFSEKDWTFTLKILLKNLTA